MKVNHTKIFFTALRSALLILGSLILYDILKEMTLVWDKIFFHKKEHELHYRKIYQLLGVFFMDVLILYFVYYMFKIELY